MEMATDSSVLAWRIPETGDAYRKAWCAIVHEVTKKLDMTEHLNNNNNLTVSLKDYGKSS